MKTAISVPDDTFRAVDDRALQLGMNRSEFYVVAAKRYLAELDGALLTAQIDEALNRGASDGSAEARELAAVGLERLAELTADDEW